MTRSSSLPELKAPIVSKRSSDRLEPFILGLSESTPSINVLRKHKLAALAFSRLSESPLKSALHQDFVVASMHHLKVKSALKPLLKVWTDAGIKVMIFKGFYLAEFLYEVAAYRAYGDVDLLIDPKDAARASALAKKLGWLEKWRAGVDTEDAPASKLSHEVLHVQHPSYPIRLDVHAEVSHIISPRTQVQRGLTQQVWQAAEKMIWEGVELFVPSLVDSALVGLVTSRSWSDDKWQLKAQDYLDLDVLKATGLTQGQLFARAKTLNCTKTLDLFLQRCNPYQTKLNLTAPSSQQLLAWEYQIRSERGSLALERGSVYLRQIISDAFWAVPSILYALRFVFNPKGLERSLQSLRCGQQDLFVWRKQRLERGIRVFFPAFYFFKGWQQYMQTLALFASLRRKGYPVVLAFVRGQVVLKLHETPIFFGLNE